MNSLRLRFDPEDDWHGRLTATVPAGMFAGEGSAWFATEELRQFAAAVSIFPFREDDRPRIAGGFWDETGADVLDQVHLSIELAPHGPGGSIRVTTRLATAVTNTETVDLASNVTARFLVTYGNLGLFASSVSDMIEGRSAEAELKSSAD